MIKDKEDPVRSDHSHDCEPMLVKDFESRLSSDLEKAFILEPIPVYDREFAEDKNDFPKWVESKVDRKYPAKQKLKRQKENIKEESQANKTSEERICFEDGEEKKEPSSNTMEILSSVGESSKESVTKNGIMDKIKRELKYNGQRRRRRQDCRIHLLMIFKTLLM